MAKINLLDSSVYNRISAGEVVERPSSVVKELIENSLDAGANMITVEIENGGTKLIRILDNGCGIEFGDIKNAFLPHATSKVCSIKDLDSIATFGFRGEALASIASVSKIELMSNTINQEVGGKICLSGGRLESFEEYACSIGTNILVKDLFFNTPARLKFLKSNKQEESNITNIVNRLILANPDVCFKYIIDGKIIYNCFNKGLKQKIYSIYGKQTLDNLIEVNFKNELYSINGFISKPTFCKANKTYQTLLVNNRYVFNNLISLAISNAYENFLMKGKFPFFVLNLKINYEDIDVNVHPSKMEVKFKNANEIYKVFYNLILEILHNSNCVLVFDNCLESENDYKNTSVNNFNSIDSININKSINFNKQEDDNSKLKNNFDKQNKNLENFEFNKGFGFSFSNFNNISNEVNKVELSSNNFISELRSNVIDTYLKKENELKSNDEMTNNLFLNDNLDDFAKDEINKRANDKLFEKPINKTINEQQYFINLNNIDIIGTIFDTYIIVSNKDVVYVLDQHAGHERLLYDNLIKNFEEKKNIAQPLLLPYSFNVNEIENNLIRNNLSILNDIGFEIEEFGYNTFKINAIPSILSGINLQEFVLEILKEPEKISNNNEQIKSFFATCACKAAVKGGQKLSNNEIQTLIEQIASKKTTLLCPHGRPICLQLTKYNVEKMFKRIV